MIYGKVLHDGWAIRAYQIFNIHSCIITDCGLGIGMVSVPCIINNIIIKNAKHGFGGGCFSDTCNYFITNSIIFVNANNSSGISTGVGGNYNISNNILIYDGPNNPGPGHGISLDWPKKVRIKNNLISGFSHNIFKDLVKDSLIIKNNVFDKSDDGSIWSWVHPTLVNNVIFSENPVGIKGDTAVKSNYNLYWNNTIDLIGLTYGDSDRVADPMFVKDTVPSPKFNFDFHLQAFSPGIDKGNPLILDKDGTRSDIGMYGGPLGEIYNYKDLAPKPPRNISAVVDSNNTKIRWNRNTETDTAFYKVYRDTVQNFTIDSTKLVALPTDTFYIHTTFKEVEKYYYYKITCVDKQGNESDPSEEIVVRITSINEYPLTISDYRLYQNYPNPFNPRTTIGYKLKDGGYVKLMVYDIKGELVSVLVNQEQDSGYYEVEFDASNIQLQVSRIRNIASGIYLYRIEVIGEGNIPVYNEMRKMLLIK